MSTKKTEAKSGQTRERAAEVAARLTRSLIEEDPRLREAARQPRESNGEESKSGETPVEIYRQRLRD